MGVVAAAAALGTFAGPWGSVTAVLGDPGAGKTTALQAAEQRGELGERRVVFDPYGRRDRRLAELGEPVSPWPGDVVGLEDLLVEATHPRCRLDASPLRLTVWPRHLDASGLGRDFSLLAELLWATGRVTFVLEEVGLYSRHAVDLMNRLSSGGRHASMRVIAVAQSFSRLPRDLRRCLRHIVAFRQADERDQVFFRKLYGPEVAERLANHKRGEPPIVLGGQS